jgi:hypothetical protein
MTKFFYNPISLTPSTFHLFPMIRTFHLYHYKDIFLQSDQIIKYIIWYDVHYSYYLKHQSPMKEYMNIRLSKKDCSLQRIEIPSIVNRIENNCFEDISMVTSIIIPNHA